MGSDEDKGRSGLFGQGLPGTGGDIGPGRGPERLRSVPDAGDDEDDVEGHLYTGGPTTQGEIVQHGPDENPRGER